MTGQWLVVFGGQPAFEGDLEHRDSGFCQQNCGVGVDPAAA